MSADHRPFRLAAAAVAASCAVGVAALVVLAAPGQAVPGARHPVPAPAASPHIRAQADRLSGRQHPQGSPSTVPVPVGVDGCNHDYGPAGACVPATGPGGARVTCRFLAQRGYLAEPLAVRRDSLGLVPAARRAGRVRVTGTGTYLTGCG